MGVRLRGGRRELQHRGGRDVRSRRRERLRQDGDGAIRAGAGPRAGLRRGGTDRAGRRGPADAHRAADAGGARRASRHDIPGARRRAEPRADLRQPDRRGHPPAQPRGAAAGKGNGRRHARQGRRGRPDAAIQAVPPPTVGRAAAAGDDRHRPGRWARTADSRRAHDRTGRCDAVADTPAPRRPARQRRPRRAADNARPGRGG